MVEVLKTLWNFFLIIGVIFLIFVVLSTFVGTIYNLLIGNKKKEKERKQELESIEKAREELFENLRGLAEELEKCSCEECEKPKKKTTKKSAKKESE